MKNEIYDLLDIGQALGRSEMKKLMAGSGGTCGGCSSCFGWGGSCSENRLAHYCGMIQSDSGSYIRCYRANF